MISAAALVIKSKPVLLHCDQQGEPNLYICSTAWAVFAVLIEPVSAKGLFHCFLDHPLPKALLHELFPFSCGRQVLISEVTQFICGTKQKNRDSSGFNLRTQRVGINKKLLKKTFNHCNILLIQHLKTIIIRNMTWLQKEFYEMCIPLKNQTSQLHSCK